MHFYIAPKVNGVLIRLKVELMLQENGFDSYRVTAKNRVLIFQTNREFLKQKGLKHKPPKWKLISGNLNNTYAFEKIVEEIEKHLSE